MFRGIELRPKVSSIPRSRTCITSQTITEQGLEELQNNHPVLLTIFLNEKLADVQFKSNLLCPKCRLNTNKEDKVIPVSPKAPPHPFSDVANLTVEKKL